jgi:hypothetical protein
MNGLFSEVASLGVGVVTGFVFERRASREARVNNEELKRQVSALKTIMLSLSGRKAAVEPPVGQDDLAGQLTQRAISTQSPEGRVDRRALRAHFVERGFAARDIDAAISSMCKAGVAKEDGSWLRMV